MTNRAYLKQMAETLSQAVEGMPMEFWCACASEEPVAFEMLVDGREVQVEIQVLSTKTDYVQLSVDLTSYAVDADGQPVWTFSRGRGSYAVSAIVRPDGWQGPSREP